MLLRQNYAVAKDMKAEEIINLLKKIDIFEKDVRVYFHY